VRGGGGGGGGGGWWGGNGDFSSITFDQGFAIQEPDRGIFVSIANDLDLSVRREVQVTAAWLTTWSLLNARCGLCPVTSCGGQGLGQAPLCIPRASTSRPSVFFSRSVGTTTGPIVPILPSHHPSLELLLRPDRILRPAQVKEKKNTGNRLERPGLTVQRLGVTGWATIGDYEAIPVPERPSFFARTDGALGGAGRAGTGALPLLPCLGPALSTGPCSL